MKSKGFAPIIILVLIALVVVGFFGYKNYWPKLQSLVIPTPTATADPTVNWKTYTDAKYSYSFKYPADYGWVKHSAGYGITLSRPGVGNQDLVVDLNPIDTKADLETFTTDRRNSLLNVGTAGSIDTTTISGLIAKHYFGSGERYGDSYFVRPNPNYILEIEVLYLSKDVISQDKPLADQILSTFKFLDQNQAVDTSSWKTYTSSCGFLMKYPEGWKAQKYFIVDKDTSCSFFTSPDYKQGLDSRTGFWIEVTRLAKGTINIETKVDTVDDYIKSIEDSYMKSSIEPLPPLIKITKTYSTFQGVQFDFSEFESVTTFVFSHGNYLWVVKWPTATQYSGSSRADLNQILSTFKFTN